ncbi:MAG: hypothetical protein ACTS2F_13865 [Thainema sp.]
MNPLFINDLTRKDFWNALGLWAGMEMFGFVVCPLLNVIEFSDRSFIWFASSLPLGIGGALLVSISSRFLTISNRRRRGMTKQMELLVGHIIGSVGLLGVMFPLLMVILEFLTALTVDIYNFG